MDFKDSLVGFLDVLGFKNICGDLVKISKYFECIEDEINHAKANSIFNTLGINTLVASDSIIFFSEVSGSGDNVSYKTKNLIDFLEVIRVFTKRMSLRGFWIRGGITFGKLAYDETKHYIAGPGLTEAYRLESVVATYPRIILDWKFTDFLKTESRKGFLKLLDLALHGTTGAENPCFNITHSNALDFGTLTDFIFIDYLKGLNSDQFDDLLDNIKINFYKNEVGIRNKSFWLKNYLLAHYTEDDQFKSISSL